MKTVLIADDNGALRKKLRNIFEQSQEWIVSEATNGRDAVVKAAHVRPDLVVLDFEMSLMNGLEAADAIKRTSPRLPLILFTAYKDEFLERRAFGRGISVVLSKADPANRLIDSARILVKYGHKANSSNRDSS